MNGVAVARRQTPEAVVDSRLKGGLSAKEVVGTSTRPGRQGM